MTRTAVWPLGLPRGEARRVYQSQPFTVYRQYDTEGVLLYVGVTDNLARRNVAHRSKTPWWPQVARIETDLLPSYWAAYFEEFRLIKTAAPLYNVVFATDREAAKRRRAGVAAAVALLTPTEPTEAAS